MVTVITNKLKKQSLEDLPNQPLKVGTNIERRHDFALQRENLEEHFRHRVHTDRRQGPGHHRTRSYPTRDSDCKGTQFLSTMHSSATPPASKKLCRSISVPEEESSDDNNLSSWVPKPSKVWHPVKVLSKTNYRPRSISSPPEKLLHTNTRTSKAETHISTNSTAVNSMSTPPASPTPRPASAFAALSLNLHSKTHSHENDKTTPRTKGETTTEECPRLKRSRSQPCFERARVCGIKRRIDDDFDRSNNLRPALDLAKMEESSYFRFRDKRRGLRIPKYSNKIEAKAQPAPYFTEHDSFILKPIVSSPLDATASSIMITPTSSPTKQIDLAEKVSAEKTLIFVDEKRRCRERRVNERGFFHNDDGLELDIASIEEDDLC